MDIFGLNSYLEDYLNTKEFESDFAFNGLQVIGVDCNKTIKHIATAVDATIDTIRIATQHLKADVLIVHHGLIWGSGSIPAFDTKRQMLEDSNCSLLAYHLPLDSHAIVGNNVQLAKFFGGYDIKPFGNLVPNGRCIGVKCKMDGTKLREFYEKSLAGRISHAFSSPKIQIPNGNCKEVAFVSGAGGDFFKEAERQGIELFVTGECRYQDALMLEDGFWNKMSVEFLGHHASETLGVRALGDYLYRSQKIQVTHIDASIPI